MREWPSGTRSSPWAPGLAQLAIGGLSALAAAGCGPRAGAPAAAAGADPGEWFVERASGLGLRFLHHNGMSGGLSLAEITCGGAALLDFDDDGDLDAFLMQGLPLPAADQPLAAPQVPAPDHLADRLYRNDLVAGAPSTLHFTDVTPRTQVAKSAYGCAAAVGDYDNDGLPDLYLANLGANQLLHNEGDGRFTDVTTPAGVGDAGASTVALFLDYDRDGWLDLFVGNYALDPAGTTVCRNLSGAPDYCSPKSFPYQADRLYRNRGDGGFDDVTVRSGLAAAAPAPALGAVAADFDGDGWQDLYVANDGEPNQLWRNRRDGTLEEVAGVAGCAVNGEGRAEASMGVDAGDYDDDGDFDLFMTHLVKETNTLFRNDGSGAFEDETRASRLGPPSLAFTSFGTRFFDYDNDGWLDLLTVSGAVTMLPELVAAHDPFPLHQTKQLFRNLGDESGVVRFEEVTAHAGSCFASSEVSRGAAFGDLDNDGDIDVLVANNNGPARVLLNQVGSRNLWAGVRLVGGAPPRDRLGAAAGLVRGGRLALWRRAAADGSYASASDSRVVFGLGSAADHQGLRVVWPDGEIEDFAALQPGRYTTVRQGTGRAHR